MNLLLTSLVVANAYMKSLSVEKMISMAIVPSIKETRLMEDIMAKNLHIEISIAKSYDDDFDHWGYYDNIGDAIDALIDMEEHIEDFYEDVD